MIKQKDKCRDKLELPESSGAYGGVTFNCELEKGHEGPHQETDEWDGRIYKITWEKIK